jgi:hypothetical protein
MTATHDDPITTEVIGNALASVAEEMGAARFSSKSPINQAITLTYVSDLLLHFLRIVKMEFFFDIYSFRMCILIKSTGELNPMSGKV